VKNFLLLFIILVCTAIFSYNIKSGDKLQVIIKGLDELNEIIYIVQPDGTITLPYIGDESVADKDISSVQEALKNRYNAFLTNPEIIIVLVAKSPITVSVLGTVEGGGKTISVPDGSTILDVIAASGIELKKAKLSNIKILRKDGTIIKVNAKKLIKKNDKILINRYKIRTGDVIYISKKVFYFDIDNIMKVLSLTSSIIVLLHYFNIDIN
jgi:protein involved in polysaccharide export with SLBB domain